MKPYIYHIYFLHNSWHIDLSLFNKSLSWIRAPLAYRPYLLFSDFLQILLKTVIIDPKAIRDSSVYLRFEILCLWTALCPSYLDQFIFLQLVFCNLNQVFDWKSNYGFSYKLWIWQKIFFVTYCSYVAYQKNWQEII